MALLVAISNHQGPGTIVAGYVRRAMKMGGDIFDDISCVKINIELITFLKRNSHSSPQRDNGAAVS
jgi:hypothetical protein